MECHCQCIHAYAVGSVCTSDVHSPRRVVPGDARRTQAHGSHGLTMDLCGPGRAPKAEFPTPFQWRTSISFKEPLLIDQYLPALGLSSVVRVWHVRPSLPAPPSTPPIRRLQVFHHGTRRPRCAQWQCGAVDGGTCRRAYHEIRLLVFAEPKWSGSLPPLPLGLDSQPNQGCIQPA
jgi:hypothetical protein